MNEMISSIFIPGGMLGKESALSVPWNIYDRRLGDPLHLWFCDLHNSEQRKHFNVFVYGFV